MLLFHATEMYFSLKQEPFSHWCSKSCIFQWASFSLLGCSDTGPRGSCKAHPFHWRKQELIVHSREPQPYLSKGMRISVPSPGLSPSLTRRNWHHASVQPECRLWEQEYVWFPILPSCDLPERVPALVQHLVVVLNLNPKNLTLVQSNHKNEFL